MITNNFEEPCRYWGLLCCYHRVLCLLDKLQNAATTTATTIMTSNQTSQLSTNQISVSLKWNKQVFSTAINVDENSSFFKQRVEEITGVPMARQKLLSKQQRGGWKGSLKDDVILSSGLLLGSADGTTDTHKAIVVTLIGSADTLAPTSQKTTFLEDLSPQELQAEEEALYQAAMETAEGMISALQLPPHQRDDNKQEQYQYNRLVVGLPQRQIEQELKYGQGANDGELQGKVAMNFGLELRRAYVNDIAVLYDGTCVSVLDDGHIQLWKHGAQQKDAIHAPGIDGGVTSVVSLRRRADSPVAFATVGRGAVYLWSIDGDVVMAMPAGLRGMASPDSLVSIFGGMNIHHANDKDDETFTCLAARFQVTRLTDPAQFRLVPQNEEERRRRAQAEAQEQAVQQALSKASRSIQIWYSIQGSTTLRSKIVELTREQAGSAAITCLETISYTNGQRFLVAGDTEGRLWIWKAQPSSNGQDIDLIFQNSYLMTPSQGSKCTIVCLCALRDGRLAVSTDLSTIQVTEASLIEGLVIDVDNPRSVTILDVSEIQSPKINSVIGGHDKDAVMCACQLPNGDLLTAGGKLDATLQVWSRQQVYGEGPDGRILVKSKKTLTDVGYVFALSVLLDSKVDSNYYAVAAARYNTVKLVL